MVATLYYVEQVLFGVVLLYQFVSTLLNIWNESANVQRYQWIINRGMLLICIGLAILLPDLRVVNGIHTRLSFQVIIFLTELPFMIIFYFYVIGKLESYRTITKKRTDTDVLSDSSISHVRLFLVVLLGVLLIDIIVGLILLFSVAPKDQKYVGGIQQFIICAIFAVMFIFYMVHWSEIKNNLSKHLQESSSSTTSVEEEPTQQQPPLSINVKKAIQREIKDLKINLFLVTILLLIIVVVLIVEGIKNIGSRRVWCCWS